MCLIILGLNGAYDMVSHSILLSRLRYQFGLGGSILKWLENYLTGRVQQLVIEGSDGKEAQSEKATLAQGVPQGSVLGPKLFSLYISPFSDICRKYRITFHSYADDQKMYLGFKPSIPEN